MTNLSEVQCEMRHSSLDAQVSNSGRIGRTWLASRVAGKLSHASWQRPSQVAYSASRQISRQRGSKHHPEWVDSIQKQVQALTKVSHILHAY